MVGRSKKRGGIHYYDMGLRFPSLLGGKVDGMTIREYKTEDGRTTKSNRQNDG